MTGKEISFIFAPEKYSQQEKGQRQMCTVSIKVDDNLLNMAGLNLNGDVDVSEWIQHQVEAILIRMSFAAKKNVQRKPHSWDNYELSQEMLAMMPKKRRNVFSDYKEELSEILEEKYR